MDPLQRREPAHEKCPDGAEYCANSAGINRSAASWRGQHEGELARDTAEALKRCVKNLLMHGETNDLAHELISTSIIYVNPLDGSDPGTTTSGAALANTATTQVHNNSAVNGSGTNGGQESLIELASLNGLLPGKIGGNLSLARLDLAKLSARLPAQEDEFKLEALNEQWQLYLRVLYTFTAIVSILLNLITVIVLYRAKPSELRKYLINLAIGDLFMSCFSIPFTYTEYMLGYWDYPPFLCPVVKFVVTLAVYVSVCTMVVIGVNRHVAILYPMKKCSERVWKCSKNAVICGIWLSGIIISSPEYLMFKSTQFCYNQKYLHDCRNMWGETFSYYYTIFIYLTTFVIPFMLLCYLYSSIGIQLKHREMPGNADASRDLTMQTKRAKVVKMLIVVVVVFAIFWLPLQTFSLIMFLWPSVRQVEYNSPAYTIFVGTYFTFHWLSMAHSCLNPLIYCFMNPKFRKDLRDLICGLHRWPGDGVDRTASSGRHGSSFLANAFFLTAGRRSTQRPGSGSNSTKTTSRMGRQHSASSSQLRRNCPSTTGSVRLKLTALTSSDANQDPDIKRAETAAINAVNASPLEGKDDQARRDWWMARNRSSCISEDDETINYANAAVAVATNHELRANGRPSLVTAPAQTLPDDQVIRPARHEASDANVREGAAKLATNKSIEIVTRKLGAQIKQQTRLVVGGARLAPDGVGVGVGDSGGDGSRSSGANDGEANCCQLVTMDRHLCNGQMRPASNDAGGGGAKLVLHYEKKTGPQSTLIKKSSASLNSSDRLEGSSLVNWSTGSANVAEV